MSGLPTTPSIGKKKVLNQTAPYVLQTLKQVSTFLQLIFLVLAVLFIKIGQVTQTFFKLLFTKIFRLALWTKTKLIIYQFTTSWNFLKTGQTKRSKSRKKHPRRKKLFLFSLRKTKKTLNYLIPKAARFKILIIILAVIFLGYSQIIVKLATELPNPHQLTSTQRPLTTQIYDRNGKLLYQVYEGRNRKLVKLDSLPRDLINATVAIEDKHFFAHPGVDPIGIVRALMANIDEGKAQGASTITQQLIKNILLTPEKTYERKIKEALLAFWAERIYTKEEILAMYFNEAPYGGPAWGVEAAAETYFGKSSKDLNLAEIAYLAGLPASPTEYSPYGVYPEKGIERQHEVLRRMIEDKYITPDQARIVMEQELEFKPPVQEIKAPHFVMYIRSLLASEYGERTVSQGGLKVITSLDLDIQEMAEAVVAQQVEKLTEMKVGNGSAMVTSAKNGEILAMVGSKDYFDPKGGNFNVALSLRQPGSSIKPVTYATAFELGYTPGTILLDTPTTFPNPWGQAYSPVNYDGRFHGPVSIRTALGSSYNVPAVKMLALVGVPAMLQTSKEMGLTTLDKPESYGLSLTLGGGAVKMIDMMSVYGTFASGGIKYKPSGILKVTDSYGNTLEDHQNVVGERVLTEEVSYLISHILADNNARSPAFGLNSLLKIPGKTVAVKTGTSDDKRDNWAFGYTPEFVVGAWVGNNDNSPMDPRLTSGITGATPVWHDIISSLTFNQPDIAFKRPAGIIESTASGQRDLAISGQVPKIVVGQRKIKKKDEASGKEKEVITFTDPFNSMTSDQSAQSATTQ